MQTHQICDTSLHQILEFLVLVEPCLKFFYEFDRGPFKFVFSVEIFIAKIWNKLVTFICGLLLGTCWLERISVEIACSCMFYLSRQVDKFSPIVVLVKLFGGGQAVQSYLLLDF